MKPLIVLLSVFLIGYLIKRLLRTDLPNTQFLGRIAMSSMLLFTGTAHFIVPQGMIAMLPTELPFRMEAIYLTGVIEIVGAVGLMSGKYAKTAGIMLIVFLILVLPANIFAAIYHINPITGAADGHGLTYLFFRIPLQLFFITWIYRSAIT